MEYIRAIRNKEKLEGTCYFEFYLGKFNGDFWNNKSLFIHEFGFQNIQNVFIKHTYNFDEYGITTIHQNEWKKIIIDLQDILSKIENTQNYNELSKIIHIQEYYKEYYSDNFEEIKKLIYLMIKEFIIWSKENMKNYSMLSILGI